MIGKNKKGYLAMFLGSINYGLYPVIIAIAAFHSFTSGMTHKQIFLWGFVLVGIKELFNLFFQLLYIGIKETGKYKGWRKIYAPFVGIYELYKDIFKNKLTNKNGWLVVLAATLAGPLGYSIQTIGVLEAGSTLGTLLISLLPIFMIVFTKLIIKNKKITKLAILLSIVISVVVISNGIGQYYSAGSNDKEGIMVGLICGTVTGILWSLENVIMSYVSRETNYSHDSIVSIKLSSSSVILPLILIPIVSLLLGQDNQGLVWYTQCFTKTQWIGWFFLIGFVMFLARWLYFYSIKNSTSLVSSLTLVIRFAWIPLFSLMLYPIIEKSTGVDWAIFVPLAALAWGLTIMLVIHEYRVEKGAKYNSFNESVVGLFKK